MDVPIALRARVESGVGVGEEGRGQPWDDVEGGEGVDTEGGKDFVDVDGESAEMQGAG